MRDGSGRLPLHVAIHNRAWDIVPDILKHATDAVAYRDANTGLLPLAAARRAAAPQNIIELLEEASH